MKITDSVSSDSDNDTIEYDNDTDEEMRNENKHSRADSENKCVDDENSEDDQTTEDYEPDMYEGDTQTYYQKQVANSPKTADNFPTEEYFKSEDTGILNDHTLHQIAKIFRKRILPNNTTQYYVSYKHYPAKKDRVWINESDMTPALQQHAKNKKNYK